MIGISVPGTRRKRGGGHILALALAVLLLPAFAAAQKPPLAEVARKEQERRKAAKASEKVLTNKDLPPSALQPPKAGAPAPLPAAPSADQKPAEVKEEEKEQKDEAWWRGRIVEARASLQRNEMFLQALQSRVNALSTEFVARDDPYQRARIAEDRQKALAEMERVTADIAVGRKQIEDIEEEARKAGVPPGWLR